MNNKGNSKSRFYYFFLKNLAFLLMLAVILAICPGLATAEGVLTPVKEKKAGKFFFEKAIQESGLSSDAEMQDLVKKTVKKIAESSGERTYLNFEAAVVASPEANAEALPGGYILVYQGLTDIIRQKYTDKRVIEGLIAGIVAHEIAHVMHRDTDLLAALYSESESDVIKALKQAQEAGEAEGMFLAFKRDRENAADRDGLLYLLRAGYSTDDMINVLKLLVDLDKSAPSSVNSYQKTHDSPSQRLSNVEKIQEEVYILQSKYDDAVLILQLGLGGTKLEEAIENLEEVAAYFATYMEIQHAMGVAYHRRYLSTIPPSSQQYKPAFSFYKFSTLRGGPEEEDTSDLKLALEYYEKVLSAYRDSGYQGVDKTLSAAGICLINMGQTDKGFEYCRKAVELSPGDRQNLNNLGIAYQKKGDSDKAIECYQKALDTMGNEKISMIVKKSPTEADVSRLGKIEISAPLYNLALAYKAKGMNKEAGDMLLMYLAIDPSSAWGKEAGKIIATIPGYKAPEVMANETPEETPAKKPTYIAQKVYSVSGINVGANSNEVVSRFGNPENLRPVENSDLLVMEYKSRGLDFYTLPNSTISGILAIKPYSEAVGNLKINDSSDRVSQIYGTPLGREMEGDVEIWDYTPYGLYCLMNGKTLLGILVVGLGEKAEAPAAAPGSNSTGVELGMSMDQVRGIMGAPDGTEEQESGQVLWGYIKKMIAISFSEWNKVDMVMISEGSGENIKGIRIGDSEFKVRSSLGQPQSYENNDGTLTYAYPALNYGFIIKTGKVYRMAVVKFEY